MLIWELTGAIIQNSLWAQHKDRIRSFGADFSVLKTRAR